MEYEVTVDMTVTRTFKVTGGTPAKARWIAKKWAEEAQLAGAQSVGGSTYVESAVIRSIKASARRLDEPEVAP